MKKIDVLFITNKDDISVDYLIKKLKNKTKSFLRINSEDISYISFLYCPNGDTIVKIKNTEYNLSSVKSVVFKRTPIKFDLNHNDENRKYLDNERKHFFEGIYLCLKDAKWINPMFSTHIAERKLFQLKLSKDIGFLIPDTIVTNNPFIANDFVISHANSIIKPISNGLQVLKDEIYSIYTSEISKDFFKPFLQTKELFETPVFLQEKIENLYDIRVTIIGDNVIPVRIEKNNKLEVDWRKPEISKKYSITELPEEIKSKLKNLHKKLNLIYSAIDLIQKPNGEFVFLEINPVGEWVWLESELNLNISELIINELLWQK